MTAESITLYGCAPTPLASYLKALGVLRLISSPANHVAGEAADPHARGWWENECFHIQTTLSREALLHFFLEKYAPSPIIAPWNGGSGFYLKDNKDGFKPFVENTVAARFEHLSSAIRSASDMVSDRKFSARPEKMAKVDFVASLRSELPDNALFWLDATLALSGDGLTYPQLLGTGGNDGRLDFTNNFLRRLVSRTKPPGLFDASTGKPSEDAGSLLAGVLFDTVVRGLSSVAVGQFAPGAAGGPNATTGYSGDSAVNPWDFVLTLEGAVAFAGAASRRHQSAAGFGASFPFTVRTVGAGWGGVDASDESDARAEFWAPLWNRPARYREIHALFAEGRAVLNGRTARDGLDFARAAGNLGVSRGFREFERFGFLMRAGKAYLATPLGRRSATPSSRTPLVGDLDFGGWLDRVRRVGRNKGAPGEARRAIKRMEDALFAIASPPGDVGQVEKALVAIGQVVAWLAVSPDGRQAVGMPPPVLSSAWAREADDGSSEFRIAVALAGIGLPPSRSIKRAVPVDNAGNSESAMTSDTQGTAQHSANPLARPRVGPPMAAHFAPLDEDRFFHAGGLRLRTRRKWADADTPRTMVWREGPLVSNMIAVLERRLVEAGMRGLEDKPLVGASAVRLADIAVFLSGDFDDARCAELLAGLVWARPAYLPRARGTADESAIPFAYAALKPIITSNAALHSIGAVPEATRLPVPPGLIARLRAGGGSCDGRATDSAVRLAFARARASGLPTHFDGAHPASGRSSGQGGRMGAGVAADRLGAALLIPVLDRALITLINRAYPGALPEGDNFTTEDKSHAA